MADYALVTMFVTLLVVSLLGLPIAMGLIGSSALYLALSGRDVSLAAENVLNPIFNNFLILAVPLFLFAANIMNSSRISDRILEFCLALVGRFPGGLGQVNVLTSLVFSGMSGSAISDAAGVGKLVTEMMVKDDRYPRGFAGALTAASAVVGPIFPPSIPMVFYALISGASIGALFLAGVIPAIAICLTLAVVVTLSAKIRHFPTEAPVALRTIPATTLRALPALLTPVILLGGIYGGIFTPTEAAAVAAFYALLIAMFGYRTLGTRAFFDLLRSTIRTSTAILLVVAGSFMLNYIIAVERVPQTVLNVFVSWDLSAWQFLLLVNVLFLVLGCFLDIATLMLVIAPLFFPLAQALQIDMTHFGVILVINMMIGLITPPYGMLLFVINASNGIPLNEIVREIPTFVVLLIGLLFFFTYSPEVVLWLPRLMGFG